MISSNKLLLTLNTLKYLKFKQLYYRGFYILRNKLLKKSYTDNLNTEPIQLHWEKSFDSPVSYTSDMTFTFLNLSHQFKIIDWNFSLFGKLWTYNLNYFDFLQQKSISKEQGLLLLEDYIRNKELLKDGLEPYPISLRGINWIKFIANHKIKNKEIDTFLYRDYLRLYDNLEYHILGNHLLENGYSLLFGAYYFNNLKFYDKAKKIIIQELKEQILSDGAHFELSPMYHKILLNKLLDCICLLENNMVFKSEEFTSFLKEKSSLMLGFLQNISFNNNTIPLYNDAAYGISAENKPLFEYAKQLDILTESIQLGDSGYRKFSSGFFEVILDVGKVGPDYQPGHAHADTFSFCMNFKDNPIIVDTGTSTYNISDRRNFERSTLAHNTVAYGGVDSSEVWDGFRVANRAKINLLQDIPSLIIAEHDGYRKHHVKHQRKFEQKSHQFSVTDYIKGVIKEKSISSLHFHPDVKIIKQDNHFLINEDLKLICEGFDSIELKEFSYAPKFNVLRKSIKIEGVFEVESSFTLEII